MNNEKLKSNRILRTLVFRYRHWLEKRSFIRGIGNKFDNKGIRVASRIQVKGTDNLIINESGSVIYQSVIKIKGINNRVILHEGAYVSGAELYIEDNDCTIEIGAHTYIGHHSHLACTEGCTLKIGGGCMLSSYIQIRTGDSHSITDMDGNRINYGADVTIGNHCWIGEGAKILKGVTLEDDTVVGTGAIVTKSAGPNVLLSGVPARVIKENISWNEQRK